MPDTSPVLRKLQGWQMQLLDLSRANRLLYFKSERASSVPLTQPALADLFQELVVQGKKLIFPATDESALFEEEEAPAPPDLPVATVPEQSAVASESAVMAKTTPEVAAPVEATPGTVAAPRLPNNHLASSLTEARLARALYNLRARSRLAAEEQGVNVLFIAFGLLYWLEPETKNTVQSPLLLVPVKLEKERGRAAYTLEELEDDLLLNPTLAYHLQTHFALTLPDLPADLAEVGCAAYFDQIRQAVQDRPGWQLAPEAILGVFSFQKINLYQDMAEHADRYVAHPIIAALGGGAPLPPPPPPILAAELDDRVPPSDSYQVIDADSSQQEAIQAAKLGASFVLQGPPGTGKSQTITNIIAECLSAGRQVLFVSQKMAALEVVQQRLAETGLGDFCLQLHSHKRDKHEVIQELIDSLDAPAVHLRPESQTELLELEETRRKLNAYVKALHLPRFALHRSAFQAYGELARLQGVTDLRFELGDVSSVNAHTLAQREQLLNQFEALSDIIDRFPQHPWRGVTLRSVSFAQRDRLTQALDELLGALSPLADRLKSLAALCQLRAPRTLQEADLLLGLLKDNDPRLFTLDLDVLQQRFEQDYHGVLRTLKGSYRAEIKTLDDINRPDDKLDYEEAVTLLRQAQVAKRALAGEPAQADAILDVRVFVQGTLTARAQLDPALGVLKEIFGGEQPRVDQQPFDQVDFAALLTWLAVRRASLAQLEPYTALLRLSDEAAANGLGSFGKAALEAQLPAQQWRESYWLDFWRAFVDAAAQLDPVLRDFDSQAHTTLIARFREIDRQQLVLNRARIRALLNDRRPANTWIESASAETAILRREAAKKRRLKPLRQLLAEIPRLISDLKPCLLMSPLSVATLLDPAIFQFDVVIFDEASQVPPEEAAGAIVRGAQAVIVGDAKQLPPTRFFSVIGSDDEDTVAEEAAHVFESILDESTGLNLPQKMLRWHYRSRAEELIAFSNHHFYGDRLFTFPDVQEAGPDLGVEFIHVPDGVYRRGQTQRRNEVEARRVVDLIFEHAARRPDQTLGVIAFSYAQRDAITAEWEKRRRAQPQFEAFFDENRAEPFFIKNLEMVQGDERDVMIFSIGYGKDESGKVLMNFGPLNQDGGERRLNVAVTRARCNVKLVSSLMPEDIDLTRTQSLGARLLRDYMFYARDGVQTLGTTPGAAGDAPAESPFEEAVYQALTARGLTLRRQVGVSSYRIDLAVVDPQQPGHYLLGIECDGAMYHSAPTARERDRLRQQVLEQLGWKIQRIWSRDWIGNSTAEVERVMARLKEPAPAAVVLPVAAPEAAPPATTDEPLAAEAYLAKTQTPEEVKSLPTYVWPYLITKLPAHTQSLSQATPHEIADEVVKVVGTEGPVHVDVLSKRIGAAWQVARLTPKIKQLIATACEMGVRDGRLTQRAKFLWPIGLATPIVRAPNSGDDPRPIDYLAPEEIAEAAFLCVQEARSLSEEDVLRETARLFGYARRSAKIDAALKSALEGLVTSGRLEAVEGVLRVTAG